MAGLSWPDFGCHVSARHHSEAGCKSSPNGGLAAMLKALQCLWALLCHIYRGWANPSTAPNMSSTRGWVARGAGRAASSHSVTATSDKVVTNSGSWLGLFVVFLLERLRNKGVVEGAGALWVTWHCWHCHCCSA